MKKSELKQIVQHVISEMYEMEQMNLQEKSPPDFPKKLHDKLLNQYKDDPSKAYATMWKIFYAKKDGNKRVDEMWMAFEGKHDETDMGNPEEKKEVGIAKKIKKHIDAFLKMHGQLKEDEADMSDPSEKKEVDHAKEIKKLADQLISMHKS